MVKLDLEKAEEPEIKLQKFVGSSKKQENSRKTSAAAVAAKSLQSSPTLCDPIDGRKTSISALLITPKCLTVKITTNWKILQEMGISDHLTCLLRNLYTGQEAKLEPDMEQQTGSKLGKEYVKAVYCQLAYLTYMQSEPLLPS